MAKEEETFNFINESLEAITSTLDVSSSDRVISICSCGAQPLAFLEYLQDSGEVLAIDYSPKQISFAKRIASLIKTGDVESLRKLNIAPKDNHYFSEQRINKIAKNLDNLHFELMDVSKKPQITGQFSKGYFSNANVNLKYFHPTFEDRALIYVAFATSNLPNNIDKFLDNRSEAYNCDMRQLYDIDMGRTDLACKLEAEHPIVYHHSIKGASIECSWTPCIFIKK